MHICSKFTYNFVHLYTFIFCLFSLEHLQVFMFVCPTVSEFRFCGCCHPYKMLTYSIPTTIHDGR